MKRDRHRGRSKPAAPAEGLLGFFESQNLELSDRQFSECQAADTDTNELQYGVPDCFAHPAHLTVLTFGYIQFKPRVLIRRTNFPDDRPAAGFAAADIQAPGEIEIFLQAD